MNQPSLEIGEMKQARPANCYHAIDLTIALLTFLTQYTIAQNFEFFRVDLKIEQVEEHSLISCSSRSV